MGRPRAQRRSRRSATPVRARREVQRHPKVGQREAAGLGRIEWARLKAAVDVPLRRGGWYRVVSLTRFEAVVSVQGQAVSVPRPYVETPRRRPRE
jgi:hypothetical protein